MIKVPCELVVWGFLPAFRRELVRFMAKSGMERRDIARILNISEAAICQYLKSRRGRASGSAGTWGGRLACPPGG